MGGVQSREPCGRDSPKYSYHEKVLQDAEAELSDHKMASPIAVNGDDHYYSAEEGDSICSLTPERTRPESSSAENFSDTSDNHDSMDEDTSLAEAHESSVFVNESLVSVDSFANETSHKNSHFNVHGDEHVRTDMNQSYARHQNGLVNLEDKGSCSQGAGCRNKDITSCQESFTHPTVMPSPNSQEQHLIKTFSESHKHVANCGASSEFEQTFLLPGHTVSATSSCKRKRCKYLESSESDSDDGNKERYKKKMKSRHRKRSRRCSRSTRNRRESNSDSDESKCGRRNHSMQSMCAINSNNEESASERDCSRCVNQKCKKQLCYTGVDEHVCDKNVDSKQLTACCHNVEKIQRHTVESHFANGRDTIESRQDGRCVHSCSHCSNDSDQQTKQSGAVQKLAEVNLLKFAPHSGSVKDSAHSQHGDILRVPEQNLKNTIYNDKLARLQNSRDSVTTTFPNRQDSWSTQSQSSVSGNSTPSKEQCPQAESVAGTVGSSPLSQRFHAGVDTFEIGPSSYNENQTAPVTNTGGFISVQESADLSTLVNVPSPKSMGNGLAQQAEQFKTVRSTYVAEPKTGTNNSFFQNRKPECQNKHKEETAADKVMHLFSAAKKEIESNIKSLLSVVTFTESTPNSSKPHWQTYLSESSSASEARLNSRSAQQTHMEASTKHQYMDGQESQEVHSPLVSQGPHKVQPAIDITIQVSPSYSHSSELSTMSSLVAQRNGNYVNSTPPAVATHPDSVRGSMQSLVSKSSGGVSVPVTNNHVISPSKHGRSSTQTDTSSVKWLPLASEHQVLNCCLAGAICMSVSVGELGEQKTSGIVNWTDGALTHSLTRCSRSVASKAGALMWASCADYIENKGSELEAPDVLTTPAGGRFDKSVVALLHVVEPRLVAEDDNSNASALVEVYANCLRFANERLGLDSISFPLIGDSTFPFDICVQSFFDAILVFLAEQTSPENFDLTSVQLTIPDLNRASFAADLISSHLQGISNQDLYHVACETYSHHFGKGIKQTEK